MSQPSTARDAVNLTLQALHAVDDASLVQLTRLNVTEIQALKQDVAEILPASNLPAFLLQGLIQLESRMLPRDRVQRDLGLLAQAGQLVARGVYGAFLATPAVARWAGLPPRAWPAPTAPVPSFRITDAHLHALLGDGAHTRCEPLQTLRCPPLWGYLQHPAREAALSAQNCVGARCRSARRPGTRLSVAAAVHLFGHRHATITRWLTHPGEHSATLHNRIFQHLEVPHVQLDEIGTRLRSRAHTLWLWVALDPITKIIPVLHLGEGTQTAAHAVVHALHQQLTPGCIPVLSSDGLNLSFSALTAHFGQSVAGAGRGTRQWLLRGGTDLWPSEEGVSAPEVGRRHLRQAVLCACGAEDKVTGAGAEWETEHGVCRAHQEGRYGRAWQRWCGKGGPPPSKRRICSCIWTGGGAITISCARTSREGSRWRSPLIEAATARGSGIASGGWPWRPG
jgi:hypothetical protein